MNLTLRLSAQRAPSRELRAGGNGSPGSRSRERGSEATEASCTWTPPSSREAGAGAGLLLGRGGSSAASGSTRRKAGHRGGAGSAWETRTQQEAAARADAAALGCGRESAPDPRDGQAAGTAAAPGAALPGRRRGAGTGPAGTSGKQGRNTPLRRRGAWKGPGAGAGSCLAPWARRSGAAAARGRADPARGSPGARRAGSAAGPCRRRRRPCPQPRRGPRAPRPRRASRPREGSGRSEGLWPRAGASVRLHSPGTSRGRRVLGPSAPPGVRSPDFEPARRPPSSRLGAAPLPPLEGSGGWLELPNLAPFLGLGSGAPSSLLTAPTLLSTVLSERLHPEKTPKDQICHIPQLKFAYTIIFKRS